MWALNTDSQSLQEKEFVVESQLRVKQRKDELKPKRALKERKKRLEPRWIRQFKTWSSPSSLTCIFSLCFSCFAVIKLSFTKWLWWVLHKCAHVDEQSEDKAGSAHEKAIQTGDALNWDFDTGFFSCIISEGPPSHCVIRLPRQLHWSWIRRHLQTFLCWITSAQSNAGNASHSRYKHLDA